MAPKYSIVIPAYNRSEYLKQAIASCLHQTAIDFEVVVSDDCSAEDLRCTVELFNDPRIRYFRSECRLKAARNHQRAVSLSTGEYVIALHSDDILLPNCLEVAGAALDRNLTAAAVYFSYAHLKGSEVQRSEPVPRLGFADARTLTENRWLENFYGGIPSSCLFRRAAFDLIGGYRTSMRLAYDYEIYVRFMTEGGGVFFLPRALALYRKHDEQSAQTSAIAGLFDVLDLWKEKNHSHWPAWGIADLVLLSFRRDKAIREVVGELISRGLVIRVLAGVPRALLGKLRRRVWPTAASGNERYVQPPRIDADEFLAALSAKYSLDSTTPAT